MPIIVTIDYNRVFFNNISGLLKKLNIFYEDGKFGDSIDINTDTCKQCGSYLTALMCLHEAIPVIGPFCSRVLPCTVRICAPAFSSIRAYSTVFSIEVNTLILAVIGTLQAL